MEKGTKLVRKEDERNEGWCRYCRDFKIAEDHILTLREEVAGICYFSEMPGTSWYTKNFYIHQNQAKELL